MAKITSIFLISSILIQTNLVTSLQCHHCVGPLGLNLDCDNGVDLVERKTCQENEICAKYTISNPGSDILTRNCSPRNICETLKLQYEPNPEVTVKNCEICEQDFCNSANFAMTTVASFSLIFILLAITQM